MTSVQPSPPSLRSSGATPLSWRIAAWASVVIGLLVLQAAATPFHVAGASMQPYTDDGDLVLANRALAPSVGDVVVLETPADWLADDPDEHERIVKRVIGVAGDRISCCDAEGGLVRNGVRIDEAYLAPGTTASRIGFDVVVPPGHIWVLGDNRDVSRDSRIDLGARTRGAIPLDALVGVVWARFG